MSRILLAAAARLLVLLSLLVFLLLLLNARGVSSLAPERSRGSFSASSRSSTQQQQHQPPSLSSSPLFARQWRSYQDEDESDSRSNSNNNNDDASSMQKSTSSRRLVSYERPTLTLTQHPDNPVVPDKPKIVVLGASGKIGRLVVRQLLEQQHLDMTIVACCRDYDKACRVLYDDLLVTVAHNRKRRGGGGGPKLQIVQADLVPPEELPGRFDEDDDEDDEDDKGEAEWLRRAQSAARFYQNSVKDYDDRAAATTANGAAEDSNSSIEHSNEALEEAIRGCTAIISCVGAVRPTNLWTDIVARPLVRLLRPDVSDWCRDARHPYYVHFCSTRKVLAYAEREQLRREAAAAAERDEQIDNNHGNHYSKKAGAARQQQQQSPLLVPRIRFIRISDLCVSQPPWAFIPWLTNLLHSMVFRYQDMAEQILQSSSVLETIVLRPGDLVDDLRDENTTSLQVGLDGKVPAPSRVGRDDVAALAVAATLFDSSAMMRDNSNANAAEQAQQQPFHYKLAVRWAGQQLDPYPAQGSKGDGSPNAFLALQSALRTIRKRDKFKRRKRLLQEKAYADSSVVRFARQLPRVRRKLKLYGVCVAIPVYLVLAMMTKALLQTTLQLLLPPSPSSFVLPGKVKDFVTCIMMKFSWQSGLPFRRVAQKYISF